MWVIVRKPYTLYRVFFLGELDYRLEGLAQEAFNLVKHGKFSYHDIMIMSGEERWEFLELLRQENQREKDYIDSSS